MSAATPEGIVQHIVTGHLGIVALSERHRIATWDITACRHFGIALDWVVKEVLKDILKPDSFFEGHTLPQGLYLDDPHPFRISWAKNLRFIEKLKITTDRIVWEEIWARVETKIPNARSIPLVAGDFSGFFGQEPDIFSGTI